MLRISDLHFLIKTPVSAAILARIFHECFSAKLQKMHNINGLILIIFEDFEVHFVPQRSKRSAKKHSPFGRVAFAHLLRYQGLAVPKYSFAPECLANERMQLVKYAG